MHLNLKGSDNNSNNTSTCNNILSNSKTSLNCGQVFDVKPLNVTLSHLPSRPIICLNDSSVVKVDPVRVMAFNSSTLKETIAVSTAVRLDVLSRRMGKGEPAVDDI